MDFEKLLESIKMQLAAAITNYGGKVLLSIAALVVGLWLIGRIQQWINRLMNNGNIDKDIQPFLASLINVTLKVLLLLSVAGVLGIETTSFAAIIGAAGLAVGLALQGSLSNFAGGVLILTFKPFRVGDYITTQGFTGYVEGIQIFNTVLRTRDNKTIIIPNGPLSNGPVTNFSTKGALRVDMTFGCGLQNNSDKVKASIQKVVDACPTALKDRTHDINISKLNDATMIWDVRVWCDPDKDGDTSYFIHENIQKQFAADGIEGPKVVIHNINTIKN